MGKKYRFWDEIKCAKTTRKSNLVMTYFEIVVSERILDLLYAKLGLKDT